MALVLLPSLLQSMMGAYSGYPFGALVLLLAGGCLILQRVAVDLRDYTILIQAQRRLNQGLPPLPRGPSRLCALLNLTIPLLLLLAVGALLLLSLPL